MIFSSFSFRFRHSSPQPQQAAQPGMQSSSRHRISRDIACGRNLVFFLGSGWGDLLPGKDGVDDGRIGGGIMNGRGVAAPDRHYPAGVSDDLDAERPLHG
jgi:hypothetical protein